MPLTQVSPMRMRPPEASSSPAIMRSEVVLPQPEGPSNTTNSPDSIFRFNRSTATTEPNFLTTSSKVTDIGKPPASILSTALSLHGSKRKPAHEVTLHGERKNQNRNHRHHARRAHRAPLDFILRHTTSNADRQGDRGIGLCQDEREQKFVPANNQTEDRRRSEARRHQRQNDTHKSAHPRIGIHTR